MNAAYRERVAGERELFELLDELIAPLLASGWQLIDKYTDRSDGRGECAVCELERDNCGVEVEVDAHRALVGWTINPEHSADAEPAPPAFELVDPDVSQATVAYAAQGWL